MNEIIISLICEIQGKQILVSIKVTKPTTDTKLANAIKWLYHEYDKFVRSECYKIGIHHFMLDAPTLKITDTIKRYK